jgi:hypothetical protein
VRGRYRDVNGGEDREPDLSRETATHEQEVSGFRLLVAQPAVCEVLQAMPVSSVRCLNPLPDNEPGEDFHL